VYDVGSNLGVFSILLAKKVGTKGVVVAFVPETQTFSHLQDNIKLNNFNNVKAFNLALAECDKDAELYLGQVTGACSLVKQADGGHGFQKVKVRKGDSFVTKEKLPLPNLVKIDVEGAEYDVIKGLQETLSESACKFVCCEVHTQALPSGKRPDDIFNLLKSLGFNKIEKYERGTDEFHILAQKL